MSLLLLLTAGALCGFGAYLLLGRQLSRVIIGIGLLGHGVVLMLLMSGGRSGDPAFSTPGASQQGDRLADPLPQAFILTAIVISFGVVAFLLSLAYRSWVLTSDDHVEDDPEDRRIGSTEATGDQ